MENKHVDDLVLEAVFRQAVIDDYDDEVSSIPSNQVLASTYHFTSGFELRMKKRFQKERRKTIYKQIQQTAVIASAAALLFCILMANPDVRAAVKDVFIGWHDQFASFASGKSNDTDTAAEIGDIYPGYLPGGYQEREKIILDDLTRILFTDNNHGQIWFLYQPLTDKKNISFDIEQYRIEEIRINRNTGLFMHALKNSNYNALICNFENKTVEIRGSIAAAEIMRIYESLYAK